MKYFLPALICLLHASTAHAQGAVEDLPANSFKLSAEQRAEMDSLPLQGTVSQTGTVLQGGVIDNSGDPLRRTFFQSPGARVPINYSAGHASMDNAQKILDAELKKSGHLPLNIPIMRRPTFDAKNAQWNLDAELNRRNGAERSLPLPSMQQPYPDLSAARRMLDAELAASSGRVIPSPPVITRYQTSLPSRQIAGPPVDLGLAHQQLNYELSRGSINSGYSVEIRVPKMDLSKVQSQLESEKLGAVHSNLINDAVIQQQLKGTLRRPALVEPLRTKIDEELRDGKYKTEAEIRFARERLEGELKRSIKHLDPTMEIASGSMIDWSSWYRRFDQRTEALLVDALDIHENPAGSNTLQITVFSNCSISVRKLSAGDGGNSVFDAATMTAYSSLNGNSALEFPPGSLRSQVTFFVTNERDMAGSVPSVDSRSLIKDREFRP